MFFITGDTHGRIDVHKLNAANFPIQKELTRDDFVIVCGDFGFVWSNDKEDLWWQKWLSDKPFTTLFCDGNHENHDLLAEYPISEWNGGKVHFIQPNVIHLMRGQVYDIDGVRFFAMGGAASHDKEYREEGVSWWAKEMPSAEEFAEAERNLEAAGWKVDYVITHDAPTSIQAYLGAGKYVVDELNAFFERLLDRLEFDTWYFGHYHQDVPMGKYRAIYNDIVLAEKDRAMALGAPLQEIGNRNNEPGEVSSSCQASLREYLDGTLGCEVSVEEKIEQATKVFEMLNNYEGFRKEMEKT